MVSISHFKCINSILSLKDFVALVPENIADKSPDCCLVTASRTVNGGADILIRI